MLVLLLECSIRQFPRLDLAIPNFIYPTLLKRTPASVNQFWCFFLACFRERELERETVLRVLLLSWHISWIRKKRSGVCRYDPHPRDNLLVRLYTLFSFTGLHKTVLFFVTLRPVSAAGVLSRLDPPLYDVQGSGEKGFNKLLTTVQCIYRWDCPVCIDHIYHIWPRYGTKQLYTYYTNTNYLLRSVILR